MMKKTLLNEGTGMAALVFLAVSPLTGATPEMGPSGENEISEFIAMDVASDSHMQGTEVTVDIKDGIAVLKGKVTTLDQAERAVERAMAATGVRAVINRINLVAPTVSDSALRTSVLASLKKDGAIDAGRITASVRDGIVTLNGEVGTWDEQEIAREIVSGVSGVRAIENRTDVVFESPRTDAQIQKQLAGLIANDPLYDGLHLSVSVNEGIVRLNGEVGSKGEYDRLVRRTAVTGIFEVNADRLKVNHDLKMEGVQDKHFSPEKMNEALADAFRMDDRLDSRAITVKLSEGIVTLEGTVIRDEEKIATESTARGVPGVMAVDNRLKVSDSRPQMVANAPLVTPR